MANPLRFLGYVFSSAWRWLRSRSRRQVLLGSLVSGVLLAAVGVPLGWRLWQGHRERRIAAGWQQFEEHLQRDNLASAEAELKALQQLAPDDVRVARRLEMFRTRHADAGD